ncbi:hypothetical protein [Rhodobacter maris]|uniref:Uncharacterized protein n=1 Tax=Rhodobacter maris TaxID=446682 RepID=A0A285T4R1_9RHOB|nr:hypothetical protein [Rhodobacter maris]SOC16362.1 hypothetical protein SAMN05877831_11472 [Rhodobacter maris]
MRLELAVMALSLVAGPVAAVLGAPATGTGPWVVVVPPWQDAEGVAEQAMARLIGPVQAPLGHLVTSADGGAPARLLAAGAWAVVDADSILQLCGVDQDE